MTPEERAALTERLLALSGAFDTLRAAFLEFGEYLNQAGVTHTLPLPEAGYAVPTELDPTEPYRITECLECGDVWGTGEGPCGCASDRLEVDLCLFCQEVPGDGYPYCSDSCALAAMDAERYLRDHPDAPRQAPVPEEALPGFPEDWTPERRAAREEFDAAARMDYTVILTEVDGHDTLRMRIPITGYEGEVLTAYAARQEAQGRIAAYLGVTTANAFDIQILRPETAPQPGGSAHTDPGWGAPAPTARPVYEVLLCADPESPNWLLVNVPGVGVTQAATYDEVTATAYDFISTTLEVNPAHFEIQVSFGTYAGVQAALARRSGTDDLDDVNEWDEEDEDPEFEAEMRGEYDDARPEDSVLAAILALEAEDDAARTPHPQDLGGQQAATVTAALTSAGYIIEEAY